MTGETTRRFRWRTWQTFGGELLEQIFDTPAEAGEWRREHFPDDGDADDAGAPLTLFAVIGDAVDQAQPITPSELAEAHWAWLHDGAAA